MGLGRYRALGPDGEVVSDYVQSSSVRRALSYRVVSNMVLLS